MQPSQARKWKYINLEWKNMRPACQYFGFQNLGLTHGHIFAAPTQNGTIELPNGQTHVKGHGSPVSSALSSAIKDSQGRDTVGVHLG